MRIDEQRPASIEALEDRRLLHNGVADVHVQFAPARVTPFDASVVDSGAVFGDRGSGLSYGWDAKRSAKPVARRDTDLSPDPRYDGFVNVRRGATWEMAVPNGTYAVHLVAGDSKARRGAYGFDVEGTPGLRGDATAEQRWVDATVNVAVTDGRLSITPAEGFRKNKLSFVDVAAIDTDSPFPPTPGSPTPAPPSGTPDSEGFVPLLNGTSLAGFTPFIDGLAAGQDPRAFFKAEGGMLHVLDLPATSAAQPFGYLATTAAYADYHLRFDYRWGEQKFAPRDGADTPRDSGLLFHVHGQDVIWPESVEVQVQEGDTGDVWALGPRPTSVTTTAADGSVSDDEARYAEEGEPATIAGGRVIKRETADSLTDWNTVDLFAQGDTAVVVVNGVVVNRVTGIKDADGNPLTSGRIAIQAEGAEAWYRNLRIKPLTSYGVGAAPPAGAGVVVPLGAGADDAGFVRRDTREPLPWDVADGVLTVVPGAGDVETVERFAGDYTLHVEFMVPPTSPDRGEQDRGNSGVGLAGSYEMQILDSFGHPRAGTNDLGAIYGVADAAVDAALPAGVWQTYDVQFTAPRFDASGTKIANARITARLNGQLVQDDVEVPIATFSFEPEAPGPRAIVLQDHGHEVRFRNIWVNPA